VPWALWGHFRRSRLDGSHDQPLSGADRVRVPPVGLRIVWKPEVFPARAPAAASYTVPMMCTAGVKEGGLATLLKTTFRNYRIKGAPAGFVSDPRTGHECGDSRYFAIPFIDACLEMRLPHEGAKDQTLRHVDFGRAWLPRPRAPRPCRNRSTRATATRRSGFRTGL